MTIILYRFVFISIVYCIELSHSKQYVSLTYIYIYDIHQQYCHNGLHSWYRTCVKVLKCVFLGHRYRVQSARILTHTNILCIYFHFNERQQQGPRVVIKRELPCEMHGKICKLYELEWRYITKTIIILLGCSVEKNNNNKILVGGVLIVWRAIRW